MLDWKLTSEQPPADTSLMITGSNGKLVCQDYFTFNPYTREFISLLHQSHYTISIDDVKYWALVPHGPDYLTIDYSSKGTAVAVKVIRWFRTDDVKPGDHVTVFASDGYGIEWERYRWNPTRINGGTWEYLDTNGDWYRVSPPKYWADELRGPLDHE